MLLTTAVSSSAKPHSTVANPNKKLQGVFGAGEAVVNEMSLCALAADQLMSERQMLKAPSLQRVMGTRQETRKGLYNKESLPFPRDQESPEPSWLNKVLPRLRKNSGPKGQDRHSLNNCINLFYCLEWWAPPWGQALL